MRPWTDRYVGLPWALRGRGPDAFDCWGLVREVLAQERHVALPSYLEEYDPQDVAELAALAQREAPAWLEVAAAAAREFDVVLLRVAGEPSHVGVVAAGGRFLHVLPRAWAVLERLNSPKWAPRVVSFHRHPEFA